MEKRGQMALKVVIELVVAFTIFFLFIYAGRQWGSGEVSQKAFIARDNAVQINSFYSYSGNGYILYPADVSKFFLDYKDDVVKVSLFKGDPISGAYRFVKIDDIGLDYELEIPELLILAKTGKDIIIDTYRDPNLNKIVCPDVDTKGSLNKKLLIDTGHGDGTELKINGLDESVIASSISQGFFIKAQGEFSDIMHSRAGSIGENTARLPKYRIDELSDNADIIVSIHSGNYAHKENSVKIYYSDIYSKKLACLILNRILDSDELFIDGANIIPDSNIRNDKLMVLIEAGNMQVTEDNMLGKVSALNAIGSAISEGLEDYYG